jgi:60 kDa SS-A/Ro ribonucleoprotein
MRAHPGTAGDRLRAARVHSIAVLAALKTYAQGRGVRVHGTWEPVAAISNLPFAGTDCALPMVHAQEHKVEVDVFVVYTDSETWHGKIHPAQAPRRYRDRMGIPAKLVVVGMVANQFSIADPEDAGMLDVVGFDTGTPAIMADFARE